MNVRLLTMLIMSWLFIHSLKESRAEVKSVVRVQVEFNVNKVNTKGIIRPQLQIGDCDRCPANTNRKLFQKAF